MEQQTIPVKRLLYKQLGGNNSAAQPDIASQFRSIAHRVVLTENEVKKVSEAVEQPKAPVYSEKDVLESRQRGFEEGYTKGFGIAKSDEAEIAKKIQVSLDDITIKLAAIGEAVKTRNNENIKELAQLALRIARKVAGNALKNDSCIEIENVVRNSLPILFEEPRINISVHPELVQNISLRITSLAKSEGLKNNIEVSGNPLLAPGSCDIQWQCGGIRSDKDALWGRIEEMCNNL